MIPEKEIEEIRKHLRDAENPLFLFDDDADGLTSFLLLWRFIKRGYGIPIKGSPKITEENIKKIEEFKADKLFIIDKAVLPQDVINKIKVPIIYIDHHPIQEIKGTHYYNPLKYDPTDSRPTSYWCYKVTQQDLWIAMIGIVGDWHVPDEIKELNKQYPNILNKQKKPNDILYNSELGKLIKIFEFSLKGSMKDSMQCIKVLTRIDSPDEILKQTTPKGKFVYKHFEKINQRYEKRLKDAIECKTESKVLLYTYPPDKDSFTSPISNELMHLNPNKVIIVAKIRNDSVNMSLRTSKIKIDLPEIIKKSLEGLEGYGGGHKTACGAHIKKEDFNEFINRFKKLVENS